MDRPRQGSAGSPDQEPTVVLPDDWAEPTLIDPVGPPAAPRRRGTVLRRIGILVIVVLVVAAAVLADAVSRQHVQSQIADQVASTVSTGSDTVGVSIGGWPFLAVMATHRLSSVDLSIPTATVAKDDQKVTFTKVSVHATDLRNVRDMQTAVVGQAAASGHLSWQELSRLGGVTVSSGGDSRVQVARTVSVLGADVTVMVSASPGIDPATRTVTLTDPRASVDGITIPSTLLTPALSAMSRRMVLPDLGSLRYESLTVDSAGVEIALAGTQVEVKDLLNS